MKHLISILVYNSSEFFFFCKVCYKCYFCGCSVCLCIHFKPMYMQGCYLQVHFWAISNLSFFATHWASLPMKFPVLPLPSTWTYCWFLSKNTFGVFYCTITYLLNWNMSYAHKCLNEWCSLLLFVFLILMWQTWTKTNFLPIFTE